MNAKSILSSPEDKTQTETNEEIILQKEWFISPDHTKVRKKKPSNTNYFCVFVAAGNLRLNAFLSIPLYQLSILSASHLYFVVLYRVMFEVEEVEHSRPPTFAMLGAKRIYACVTCVISTSNFYSSLFNYCFFNEVFYHSCPLNEMRRTVLRTKV